MADITLTGTGGLFTRLGVIIKGINEVNAFLGTGAGTVGTRVNTIQDQYEATDQTKLINDLYARRDSYRQSNATWKTDLQNLASNTIIDMAYDSEHQAKDLKTALGILIKQMKKNSQSVNQSVPTIAVAADAGNVGNSTVVASFVDGYGKNLQYSLIETLLVTITVDGQQGGTVGQESFSVTGELAQSDQLAFDWPLGSGANQTGSIIDPTQDAGTNILTNSCFEIWNAPPANNANVPGRFAVIIGTAGTHIKKNTGNNYRPTGTASLELLSDASFNPAIAQTFNDSTNGTSIKLKPNTVYAVNCYIKKAGTTTAGTLAIDLIDGSNTVVNDDNAVANSLTVTHSSITTSFTAFNGFIRTPKSLPSTLKLQVRESARINNAGADVSVYIDDLAMAEAIQAYPGGPYTQAFRGSIDAILNDKFTLSAGQTYGAFQKNFESLFGMRALGLMLPYSGSPTISDGLIV